MSIGILSGDRKKEPDPSKSATVEEKVSGEPNFGETEVDEVSSPV